VRSSYICTSIRMKAGTIREKEEEGKTGINIQVASKKSAKKVQRIEVEKEEERKAVEVGSTQF